MISNHKIFTRVRDHLLAQNEKCTEYRGGSCKYRVELLDGRLLKCAIGALIDDEHYDPDIEGVTLRKDVESWKQAKLKEALLKSGVDVAKPGTYVLLRKLQDLHDLTDVRRWSNELQDLEHKYFVPFH